MGAVGRGGGGFIAARSNYSRIVSKYDLQLIMDGKSSCSEKNGFLERTFYFKILDPLRFVCHFFVLTTF